jgi:hypothetical protein
VLALLIAFVPSILVSLALVRFANLEKYKESRFGKYIRKYMTRTIEIIRFAGYAIMAIGAWFHVVWLIPLGLVIILSGWFRGVAFP